MNSSALFLHQFWSIHVVETQTISPTALSGPGQSELSMYLVGTLEMSGA